MPFGMKIDGFWGKKEWAYQHVHMFWAFWIAYAVYYFEPCWYSPLLIGALCGINMETFQLIKKMLAGLPAKIDADAVRYFCFWTLGGCLNYILILAGI